MEAMADRWRYSAEQALTLSDWAGTPQIRVLQALCLIMNYQEGKSAYPAAGNTGMLRITVSMPFYLTDGPLLLAFYVWLSSAVRIAQ